MRIMMATCRYCGKKAGFFSEYHKACLQASLSEAGKNRKIDVKAAPPEPIVVAPRGFRRIVGQQNVLNKLGCNFLFCMRRGAAADHMLLVGPDGMGKRTLAYAFAEEMTAKIKEIDAKKMERLGDLTAIVTSLETMEVLLVQNIGSLCPNMQHLLLTALHQYKVDL